jgi:FMN hydrolase / 5-amino-6-(5-phospho-D-ribitylamino)uracil phosphatase
MTANRAILRLVTVDLDETLWPLSPTLERAEHELYTWLQLHAPGITARHDLKSLREQRSVTFLSYPELAHDVTAIRHRSLLNLCLHSGHAATVADQAMAVFLAARNQVTPYDEVPGFLQTLRSRCAIASVTNGNADIGQTLLADCVGLALTAASAGAAKPDPRIFKAALTWANATPDRALHIGDDPELDIVPAQTLGMRTVWINRTHRTWPPDLPPPDLEVPRLDVPALRDYLGLEEFSHA